MEAFVWRFIPREYAALPRTVVIPVRSVRLGNSAAPFLLPFASQRRLPAWRLLIGGTHVKAHNRSVDDHPGVFFRSIR
jgi:hypothetical protein